MATYTPDSWVLVELTHKGEKVRKVFAGWYGGYLGSDSWKLSSETVEIVEHENRFEFHQHSGSTYICYKTSKGMSGYMASVYHNWSSQNTEETFITEV